MATSRIPAAIDWLVTTFRDAPTLGQATPAVDVYDGPEARYGESNLILWVGLDDPDADDAPIAATSDQTWASLGAQRKDEQFSVYCVALAWSGDTDVRAARIGAYGIVSAVEDIVRANANLGGTILVTLHGVTGMTARQINGERGAGCQIQFRIDCKARI